MLCNVQANDILEGEVDEDPTYPWRIQLSRYLSRPVIILDLLSVLPLAICLIAYGTKVKSRPDFTWFNIARILQLVKLIQFQKNRRSVAVITQTVIHTYKTFLFMFWCILLVVLFVGAIVFALERGEFTVNEDYPEGAYLRTNVRNDGKEISPFTSLGVTLYWVVVSVCTVGYGDLVPTSHASRAICSILFLFSILILSLPVSVIGESFGKAMDQYNNDKKKRDEMSESIRLVKQNGGSSRESLVSNPLSMSPGRDMSSFHPRETSLSSTGIAEPRPHTLTSLFGSVRDSGRDPDERGSHDGVDDNRAGQIQLDEEDKVSSKKPFGATVSQNHHLPQSQVSNAGVYEPYGDSEREREIQVLESSLNINELLSQLRSHWEVCNRCQSQLTAFARGRQDGNNDDGVEAKVVYEKYQRSRAAMTAVQERLQHMLQSHDSMLLKTKQTAIK